jgi:glycosyltransferase involved in cell wall biosynthesis
MTAPSGFSVLHVAQPPDSGVTNVAATLLADQVARGWRVSLASPQASELTQHACRLGANYRSWEATRAPGPTVPAEIHRLTRVVEDVSPDLVHLHSAKAGLVGRLAIRRGRATVFQPHAWSFEAVQGALRQATLSWERLGARWADAIVCVSHDERLRGQAVGVRGRYAEIPNGIDLDAFRPADEKVRAQAREMLGLEKGPIAVLLGRLFQQKGQDTMLRAWPSVRERAAGALLVLVGDGPERGVLERMAGEGVRFAGATREVAPWIAAANVVVLPSRWEAGLTLAAMEAMAMSRSVVATDVAGMREGLLPGCGAVVPVDDEAPLAEAVATRLADPALAQREGLAARRRVEERYDIRLATARMAELYGAVRDRRLR